jgi:hypothetical protein
LKSWCMWAVDFVMPEYTLAIPFRTWAASICMKPFVFVFDFLDRALASSVFRVLARKIEILMQCQQMYLLRLQGMSNRLFFSLWFARP